MQAIDIYMSPFFDGVSTRRGSFFAGIQHGLATITTRSYHSDQEMLVHAGKAFLAPETSDEAGFVSAVEKLAKDADLRRSIGKAAKICFDENYSLPVLAERWRNVLSPLYARRPI
jgi:glycosyltransferase involved in cell wall biosynthesis